VGAWGDVVHRVYVSRLGACGPSTMGRPRLRRARSPAAPHHLTPRPCPALTLVGLCASPNQPGLNVMISGTLRHQHCQCPNSCGSGFCRLPNRSSAAAFCPSSKGVLSWGVCDLLLDGLWCVLDATGGR